MGVFWGSFAMRTPNANLTNTMELIQMYGKGQLKPYIYGHYSLEDAPKALQEMMDRKAKGKVIIVP